MNSARLAKMQCPNCDSVGTIDIDDIEAQMYCTECCIVLAMNLGESDQTRWDGDEGNVVLHNKAEADDLAVDSSSKAGIAAGGGASSAVRLESGGKMGGGKTNEAIYEFIQRLQRRTNVSDTVSIGAVALFSQYIDKLKAKTGKANIGGDGGNNAVAAAVFAITAARKGRSIPLVELAKVTRDLDGGVSTTEAQWGRNILIKRNDIARTLGIEQEMRDLDEAEYEHLAKEFHLALQWPLLSCKAAAAFAKPLNRELSSAENNVTISRVEAVAVGLYMTRASKKLAALVVPPHNNPLVAAPTTSEVLQSISLITRVDIPKITTILKLLQGNKAACDKLLCLAMEASGAVKATPTAAPPAASSSATAVVGQKRPREDEDGDVKVVRQ